MRYKSVLNGVDQEALKILLEVHAVENPRILDVTYNKGVMWRGLNYNLTKMDIDPSLEGLDLVGDCRNIPVEDKSFDVIVIDLPHLPSDIGKTSIFNNLYNTDKFDEGREKNNINKLFTPFLKEAKRVLIPNGIILCKIADLIHNHKYQFQHVEFINCAIDTNITPCDLLIKCDPKAGNLCSSKWKNVKHLRKSHCYWIVCRNGKKCEK